jgi:hypothetical protein
VAAVPSVTVDDPTTQRALDRLRSQVERVALSRRERDLVTVDLVVGTNRVRHGLGRPYGGFTVMPTVANAAYAAAESSTANPRPDLEVWIDVLGSEQPNAKVEIY